MLNLTNFMNPLVEISSAIDQCTVPHSKCDEFRTVCVCVSRARPWAVPGDRTCIPVHSAKAEGGPEAAPVGSAVRM